jgi:hypothetical protein
MDLEKDLATLPPQSRRALRALLQDGLAADLERDLSPDLWKRVWQLVLAVEAEVAGSWIDSEARLVQRFAAHLPGIAPAVLTLGAFLTSSQSDEHEVSDPWETLRNRFYA